MDQKKLLVASIFFAIHNVLNFHLILGIAKIFGMQVPI